MRILDTFNKTFQHIKKELHNIKLFKSTARNYINHYITLHKLWGKIEDLMGKKVDSEPNYNDNYIKTKIKSYNNVIGTNVGDESNNRKVPKEDCSYKCLLLISLDSVIQMGKKYFPETLLEECKYKLIKKKIKNLTTNDFYLSSESEYESDDESDDESNDE